MKVFLENIRESNGVLICGKQSQQGCHMNGSAHIYIRGERTHEINVNKKLTLRRPLSSLTAFNKSSVLKLAEPMITLFELTISLRLAPLLQVDFQLSFVQNAVSLALAMG